MKFLVIYGTQLKQKKIIAEDLDDAERICNQKIKTWVDIIMVDKTKGMGC